MEVLLLFRALLLSGFICASLYWSDWPNWRIYYPSMLFVMLVNLLASYLSYHHTLWFFQPDALITTHTALNLLSTFSVLPLTALLFLSRFPAGRLKHRLCYITGWVVVYAAIELADGQLGGISYRNGWSLWHSIFLDCVMFPLVALHHHRPLPAWLLTGLTAAGIMIGFGFTDAPMK